MKKLIGVLGILFFASISFSQSQDLNINNSTVDPVVKKEKRISHIDIRVFPNPCTNFLKIYTPFQVKNINIFNASGVVLSQQYFYHQIDVSELQKGYYFIQVETDNGTTTQKFIKS